MLASFQQYHAIGQAYLVPVLRGPVKVFCVDINIVAACRRGWISDEVIQRLVEIIELVNEAHSCGQRYGMLAIDAYHKAGTTHFGIWGYEAESAAA